jgi:hypothetical protein
MKPVDFIYEITNVCDPSLNPFCDIATIDRFDMARNGELKDLLYTIKSGTGELGLVPLANVLFYERGVEFDFCKNKTVDTSAIVTANTAPGSTVGVCAAEASTFFSPIDFTPDDSHISSAPLSPRNNNSPTDSQIPSAPLSPRIKSSPTNRPTSRPTSRPTNRLTKRPTDRPTNLPTTTPPTDKQTTPQPFVPDDEECELEVSKLIISNTCN